jgi:hypothetical protein
MNLFKMLFKNVIFRYGQIDEKFLVPKIPPDLFLSSSSSGSSTEVLPHLKCNYV